LTVFAVIHGAGAEDFYRLRGDEAGARPHLSGRGFEEFDDEEFEKLYVVGAGGGLYKCELYIEGVHCSACIWLVERLPGFLEGVASSELDFGRSVCTVTWDPSVVSLSTIARQLDSLGYAPHPARGGRAREERRREERRELVRLGVAGALAMNAMLIAFALYGGILTGMDEAMRDFLRYYSLGMATVAVFWPGRSFLIGGLAAVRARTAHMDLPISIGILSGLLGGAYNTLAGRGEVYFESVALLIFFLLIGRFVQRRQQRAARDSLELLHSMTPSRARRFDEETGVFREVPASALKPGDRVELLAGDTVPADGRLLVGESSFDLSLLSGESRPVDLGPKESVYAGCTNLSARVELEIDAVGEATRLGNLLSMVEAAAARSSPSVRFADRMAGRFTTAVLLLAGITLLVWWPTDSSIAIENAVALLIVACPCALGLATPLAIVAAVGKAARLGILVQGGEVLERLARPGRVYLDKTGTLTRGELEVLDVAGDERELAWVLAAEAHSSHPLALAIGRWGREQGLVADGESLEDVSEVLGRGLVARLGAEEVLVGSPALLEAAGVELADGDLGAFLEAHLARGQTPVLASRAGRLVAVLALGDPVRKDAARMVSDLAERGWQLGVLSGDHPRVVASVGGQLGLDPALVRGGVSPEEKLQTIEAARRELGAEVPVVMVGDGVNDAAALAAASVGVAVAGGAEASLAAADVYLREGGLANIARLFDGARRTRRVIGRGLAVSLVYNAGAAYLAMTGVINPIWAAILMPISSLSVVSLAYRSRTFAGPRRAGKKP
jgi:Cu2+-exporting ATPase